MPDCATVLVSWTVPDSFIDNFFVRHTAFRHTNGFRYVHVGFVCSLISYSLRSSSGTYGTVVVLRVMLRLVLKRWCMLRYVHVVDVCSLNSYSFRSSSGTYRTVVVLRVMLKRCCMLRYVSVECTVLYVLDERVKL